MDSMAPAPVYSDEVMAWNGRAKTSWLLSFCLARGHLSHGCWRKAAFPATSSSWGQFTPSHGSMAPISAVRAGF